MCTNTATSEHLQHYIQPKWLWVCGPCCVSFTGSNVLFRKEKCFKSAYFTVITLFNIFDVIQLIIYANSSSRRAAAEAIWSEMHYPVGLLGGAMTQGNRGDTPSSGVPQKKIFWLHLNKTDKYLHQQHTATHPIATKKANPSYPSAACLSKCSWASR